MDEARMKCDRKQIRPDDGMWWWGCLFCQGAVWTDRIMGEAYRPIGCPERRGSGQQENYIYHSSAELE